MYPNFDEAWSALQRVLQGLELTMHFVNVEVDFNVERQQFTVRALNGNGQGQDRPEADQDFGLR